MSTRPSTTGDAALVNATGKTWRQWLAVLNEIKARDLSHKEIAARLRQDHHVSGWWAQMLTVRYEQEIGRREPGQTCDGDYKVGVSATFEGDMDALLTRWIQCFDPQTEFDGVARTDAPSVSKTEKWRYWRIALEDGSKVTALFSQTNGKARAQIDHEKLADQEAVESWRAYWKRELSAFKQR